LIAREVVTERVTTRLGSAQKDTARELGVKLANLRGVLWVGLALLIGGPILGWKLGWFLNGCIAGGVGLLLVIFATVLPGNEAWLGLLGLLLIPVVAYVYYKSRHDAQQGPAPAPGDAPASRGGVAAAADGRASGSSLPAAPARTQGEALPLNSFL
jgi:hypothetical protein